LLANWGAALRFAGLIDRSDTLEPFYSARYTQSFYRGWASVGFKQFKDVVSSQLNHDLGVTYGWSIAGGHLDLTFELQNLTDAKLYDTFGVQRPGRALYAKLSGGL
jgi:vitamin B12 transporter